MYFFRKYLEGCGYSCDMISADSVVMNNRAFIKRNSRVRLKRPFHFMRKFNPMPDSMFLWSYRTASLIRRNRHYNAVIISGPPFSLFAAMFMRLHVNNSYIADIRDLWAGGPLQEYAIPLLCSIDHFMEKHSIQRMRRIITATKGIADMLNKRYKIKPHIIYNMLDADEYRSDDAEQGNYLVYAGKIDRLRENSIFFNIIQNSSNVKMILAGEKKQIESGNIRYTGLLERTELLPCIAGARAGVILISFQSVNEHNIFTSKLLDYMAMKKPVLYIGPPSDASEFIERENIGISVTENSHAAIKKGIEDIMHYKPEYTDELINRFHYKKMIGNAGLEDIVNS